MSNEKLVSLVENPVPKDLVNLHTSVGTSFGVVSPLVRRRGAELLEVMKMAAERAESKSEMNNTPLLPPQPDYTPTHVVFDQEPVIVADLWSFSNGDEFHSLPLESWPEICYRWPSTSCSNDQVFIIQRSPHAHSKNLRRFRDKN